MKNSLEQEAEEYAYNLFHETSQKQGFIAGANSKYVQIEKIKAQMECLNRAKDLDILTVYKELQQQLNKLEQ